MEAKDFLEEIDYYNTNIEGEQFEDLGIETLADMLEVYHQKKLKLLGIGGVSQQRELLFELLNLAEELPMGLTSKERYKIVDELIANNCG